jgi:hypothetical protein
MLNISRMATRSHKKTHSRKHHKGSRKQRGGSIGYSINEVAPIQTASGAPLQVNQPYDTCSQEYRTAPAVVPVGIMTGGGCGCGGMLPQRGGDGCGVRPQTGGGDGGYTVDMRTNDLIKMPIYTGSVCAPAPTITALQQGGGNPPIISTIPAGYGYDMRSVFSTNSAHYLNQLPYKGSCSQQYGGKHRKSSRRHHKGSRKHRKASRKHHKGSRKHHKGSRKHHKGGRKH